MLVLIIMTVIKYHIYNLIKHNKSKILVMVVVVILRLMFMVEVMMTTLRR
jgi:hypothetical protein